MPTSDPFDLDRFVQAQERSYDQALAELKRGKKQSHWMWFVFPQFDGLGRSATAHRYAIKSEAEARAYLSHPVLGARLLECTEAVLQIDGRSANEVFGFPDDVKLRSCLTLFASVAAPGAPFTRAIDKFFGGQQDAKTIELLELSKRART